MSSVQALETMRKLNEIKSYVRNTLDKLPGIRADLVRLDDSWQDWGFCELVEAVRKWTERNPKIIASKKNPKRDNVYHTKEKEQKVIEVKGVKCRVLIDTRAGSSYVSSKLISRLNKKPIRKESKRIETLMHSVIQKTAIYELQIGDINHEFTLKIESNKVEKEVLLEIPNPSYSEIQKKYAHLSDISITDNDTKKDLPVHVILGAGDYTKIKPQERARVGQPGGPIAELTRLGWVVISPGQESGLTNMMFSKTSIHDYENLHSLDVLGVKEEHVRRDEVVYDWLRKQLSQSPDGWYETNLFWKEKHPPLDANKSGSLGRLNSLLNNLKRND